MFEKGQVVIKVIEGAGVRTATFAFVYAVERGFVFTDREDRESFGVSTYDVSTGDAIANYVPGFRSYIVAFDGGTRSFDGVHDDLLAAQDAAGAFGG